ncbi:MAG: GntR family transcriptional regulator [Kiritimatiellae bacterium]|nr:GntR family transcriptional regulator [Kiritimatiellia bacterium]
MKTSDRTSRWKKNGLPFLFDGTRRSGLSDQLADGLRQAILTGRIKPGETLPTILEWSKLLGVSIRVPEAAIARLVSEGLIVARRRHGCVVAERDNAPNWKGHVLVVVPDSDACYYSAVQLGCVRAKLSAEGYLVTSMTVLHDDGDRDRFKYDLAPLEFALRQSVDLAVLIFNYRRSSIVRAIAKSGVPFVEFADANPSSVKGCVGSVCLDKDSAMRRMMAQCIASRVRHIMQVRMYSGNFDAKSLSKISGVKFSDWMVRRDVERYGANESMVRGAMEAFLRRFELKGRSWLPDLLYFSEDHAASGALTAMLAAGVRVPDDVRVVTMSNWGLGPVFPVSLTRLEMNPFEHGDALAELALDYLKHKKPQGRRTVPLKYIEGDSFRL